MGPTTSVWHIALRACEIPRSISKTVNNFFHYDLHLRPKKKATHTAEMMSVLCVAIFWVINASSYEKSCLQFSIPTGSGQARRETFHIVLSGGSISTLHLKILDHFSRESLDRTRKEKHSDTRIRDIFGTMLFFIHSVAPFLRKMGQTISALSLSPLLLFRR